MRILPALIAVGFLLLAGGDTRAASEKDRLVSINLTGQSLHEALTRVFQQAGVEFREDAPQIQGEVRAQIENVPLPVALRLILRQAKPPLTFRIEDGVYHIIPRPEAQPAVPSPSPTPMPAVPEVSPWTQQQLDNLRALGREYGIQFVYRNLKFPNSFSGEEAPLDQIAAYVESVLTPEWKLYPVSLVKRTRLRRVMLCRKFTWLGHSLSGLAPSDTFFVNIGMRRGWAIHTLHHEFFHTFDHYVGQVVRDDQWDSLNPPGFRYGAEGNALSLVREASSELSDRNPGFFNRYSTADKNEDRAEVFAYMMTDPQMVAARMAKDPVINAKVRWITELMSAVCPEMDAEYWRHRFQRGQPKPTPASLKPS